MGNRFIASYSGGKDSVLALYRAMNAGLTPLGLITAHNSDAELVWYHGAGGDIASAVSRSLNLPLTFFETTGERLDEDFVLALIGAKEAGADTCVFGDIDSVHIEWCTWLAEQAGLAPLFPLRGEDRESLVNEFIDSGFEAAITAVDTACLPARFLGRMLDRETVEDIRRYGVDICGENGEYHTFVFDGPIFSRRIDFAFEGKAVSGNFVLAKSMLDSNKEIGKR